MNEYEIISERCGEPGATFNPGEGVNVEALVEHGFIKPKNKNKKPIIEEQE